MRVEILRARAAGVGFGVGVGVDGGVPVGVGDTGGEGVGVDVGVGVAGGVAVAVGFGVGDPSQSKNGSGAWIVAPQGVPVLKKAIIALLVMGGRSESNRKLYNVPQRSALAFWFCAKVSECQTSVVELSVNAQAVLL